MPFGRIDQMVRYCWLGIKRFLVFVLKRPSCDAGLVLIVTIIIIILNYVVESNSDFSLSDLYANPIL